MQNPDLKPLLSEPLFDLEGAAWITADDDLCPRLVNPLDLSIEKRLGQVRVEQIVGPGAAAADVGFLQLDKSEPRDRLQQPPRLLPNLLTMRQMTGVVIGDGQVQRLERPA